VSAHTGAAVTPADAGKGQPPTLVTDPARAHVPSFIDDLLAGYSAPLGAHALLPTLTDLAPQQTRAPTQPPIAATDWHAPTLTDAGVGSPLVNNFHNYFSTTASVLSSVLPSYLTSLSSH